MHFLRFYLAMTACLIPAALLAQRAPLPSYLPDKAAIDDAYRQSALLDSTMRHLPLERTGRPHWARDGRSFWYVDVGPDSVKNYFVVSTQTGRREALAGKPKDTSIERTGFAQPPSRWDDPEVDTMAPGGRRSISIRSGNLWLHDVSGGQDTALTTDGTDADPYTAWQWSPDGEHLVAYHMHPVNVKKVYYILTSVPGTTRGVLKEWEYLQPGDSMPSYRMWVYSLNTHTGVPVDVPVLDFFGPPRLHWEKDSHLFLFEKVDRGHQRFRIFEADVRDGHTRTVVDERTRTFIYTNRIYTDYLPSSGEIVWSSEKDGWYHLYLVDVASGSIKNVITPGPWVVRGVDSVDEKKREVWFHASGMTPGEDPYNIHYYRIGLDGKHLIALTPATGNHEAWFSPDRSCFVEACSQVDVPPVYTLRRTVDGHELSEFNRMDIKPFLETGMPLPEPFVAKGRDGVTDIYGIVCRPRNLDTTKRYPVIENIYAGPQDSYVPKNFMPWGEMQSLAQLGFIVVQMDGMGTANRSKAFHYVCWKNLADAGFPDRIAWMRALAAKYSYVDTTRVGVYGTSAGGQNALGALLFHPEFYKAAVAAAGCHDNRVDKQWWNEEWMGYPVDTQYAEQSNVTNAWRLRGDLLLVVGEADENVPPESTYRVVDALIKHDKYFDLLVVPGMGHGDGGPYGRRKKRDFFVKHLLGVDPPDRNMGTAVATR